MFRYNLRLIYRNFKRFKGSFFINLVGLSTGIACALLIYLWVHDELTVDKFNEKDSRLFQVMKTRVEGNEIDTDEDTPGHLARALAEEMPEVEKAVSVFPPADFSFKGVLSEEDSHVKASAKFAGSDYFKIFSYPIVQGSGDKVLTGKNAVAISEELAMKLFHTAENVVGKTVEWKGESHSGHFLVSAVFKGPPSSATVQFDLVFNYDLALEKFPSLEKWRNSGPSTYLVLKEGTDAGQFSDKISGFVKSKYKDSNLDLFLRPYSDRYLYDHYENGEQAGGRIMYVRLFSLIALFILIIACINFMNLATAKASGRLKEVGIKKATGASRKTLIFQYLGESMLLAFSSLVIALLLVLLLLPQFNEITGKELRLHFDMTLALTVLGVTLFTGLAAGSYPALYLSGFNPVAVLKGKLNPGKGELWARKKLVIFQFSASIILVISVLVVYRQMEFIQSRNLGYDRDNIIYFSAEGTPAENPETFLSEIRKIPGIVNASYMDGDLVGLHSGTTGLQWGGQDSVVDFEALRVGYGLIEILGITLKEGRTFDNDFASESSKIIFNEAAIKSMGLQNPIGKTIKLWGNDKQIIGVVKNFHFESLYEEMKPFFFTLTPEPTNILVKIEKGKEKAALERLGEFYRSYNQGLPFDYKFLDQAYQAMYASEARIAVLSRYFAGLAILISCLGLFGLSAFTAERRQKEIGIRKVLGASISSIMRLLSKDFVKLVLIAILVATPIAWYLMNRWLQDFAYHVELSWWMFALASLLALAIALLTVSFQSVKAALVNPVKSLRSE